MTDKDNIVINIAKDFSRVPAGRYRADGKFSAVNFRSDFLVPKLLEAEASNTRLQVVLDGVLGYSSSFLEEAFGGLVRESRLTPEIIYQRLMIVANSSAYEAAKIDALKYIEAAVRQRRQTH